MEILRLVNIPVTEVDSAREDIISPYLFNVITPIMHMIFHHISWFTNLPVFITLNKMVWNLHMANQTWSVQEDVTFLASSLIFSIAHIYAQDKFTKYMGNTWGWGCCGVKVMHIRLYLGDIVCIGHICRLKSLKRRETQPKESYLDNECDDTLRHCTWHTLPAQVRHISLCRSMVHLLLTFK